MILMKRAFTLIELLVVIGVISILISAAFAVLRPLDYIKRSRDSRRISDLKVVQTALEQYYANNSAYPPNPPGAGSFTFGSAWVVGPVTYLRQVPQDPSNPPATYYYNKDFGCAGAANSGGYVLCANLEMSAGTCQLSSPAYNYCQTNPF